MLNEGRGISDVVKDNVDIIYDIFLNNSYSNNFYNFNGTEITINFIKKNNYYSNIEVNKKSEKIINIGIPDGHKEKRVKENIVHELTHLMEILNLSNKYPKHNRIKKSLVEFGHITNEIDVFKHMMYKTLDNEINANVAQTYIYLKNFRYWDRLEYVKRLREYNETIEYEKINKLDEDVLIDKILFNPICIVELHRFNDILISNGVKTYNIDNIKTYVKKWIKIFKTKSKIFLIRQYKIIDEIMEDMKKYENYNTEYPEHLINFNIKKYDEFINETKSYKYEFGCVMLNLKVDDWKKKILPIIDEEDIYDEPRFGLEDECHVTVFFGIIPDKSKPSDVKEKIKESKIDIDKEYLLENISIFEKDDDYDVVKFDVKKCREKDDVELMNCTDLRKLNKLIKEIFPNKQDFPDYKPHVTIGYTKKGMGKKYIQKLKEPIIAKPLELVYSYPIDDGKNKRTITIIDYEK